MPFDIYTSRTLAVRLLEHATPSERGRGCPLPGVLGLVRSASSAGCMFALCLIRAVGRAVFLEGNQHAERLLPVDGKRREVRLAARSEGGGEAGRGVAYDRQRGTIAWRELG